MKIGYFILRDELRADARMLSLLKDLEQATFEVYEIHTKNDVQPETDLVLSMGGDGTFLSAAHVVADIGLPILGVNFGRIGFLCENRPEDVSRALVEGDFRIEYRTVLNATLKGPEARKTIGMLPYSVNEVALHRAGSAVLGIHVSIDGEPLPTYWADGLIVATSSGSTAYSLSVGGPICMPDTKVLVVAPIAPHNLNVRPIVLPETAKVDISFESRDGRATMSTDNRVVEIQPDWSIHVEMAQFSLKRIRLAQSGFVKALTSRLFWGEDMRNNG
ncbi:MAG: NAD(+)/NADH kinase [Bacteroidales bacterium]|nr:NAD(+)/NADH kinase [Bacteroidales bacterium]MBR1783411.1 NAD(+)/NADH kinase [Bacteroidales bacterium]